MKKVKQLIFDIDNTLKSTRIEVKVNNGISDRNVKYAFRTAIFNITPDNGYIVSSVTCDNGAVGNVDGNKVIITNFNKNQTCEVITSLNSPGENSTLVDAIKYYNSRVSTRTEFNAPFIRIQLILYMREKKIVKLFIILVGQIPKQSK